MPRRSVGADPGRVQRLARDRAGDVPDLGRIVLDPAGLREVLLELAVGAADQLRIRIEDEAGGAGGPLVDRQDHAREIYRREPAREVHAHEIGELAAAVNEARSVRPVARCSRSSSISFTRPPARTASTVMAVSIPNPGRKAANARAARRARRAGLRSAQRARARSACGSPGAQSRPRSRIRHPPGARRTQRPDHSRPPSTASASAVREPADSPRSPSQSTNVAAPGSGFERSTRGDRHRAALAACGACGHDLRQPRRKLRRLRRSNGRRRRTERASGNALPRASSVAAMLIRLVSGGDDDDGPRSHGGMFPEAACPMLPRSPEATQGGSLWLRSRPT